MINNQVADTNATTGAAEGFLNAAADQAKGKTAIDKQMYDDVIQEAGSWTHGQKEQFLGELSAQYVTTMFTDASWTDKYNDVFFENSERFGAIVQIINTEMPEVRENRQWDIITSGTTMIGANTVYLPVVKEQLVGGTSSWAIPYALSGIQMDSAFRDEAGLRHFEAYVRMSAENSAKYHLSRMSAANRNNFIAEKVAKGNSATNVNVVNLVEEYQKITGGSGKSMTASEFLSNANNCLLSVNKTFKKYKAFLTDITTMFSMDPSNNGRFIPEDRFVFILLSDFAALLESVLYSSTFHDNFVTLKGYREIPSWQGLRSSTDAFSFTELSTLNVGRESSVINTESIEVNTSGIIGLMCDRWAIIHTIVNHRLGVQYDGIKNITLYEHQFTDRYINNLMLNGLVFTVSDYTAK